MHKVNFGLKVTSLAFLNEILLHTQGLHAVTHSNQLTNQKCRDFEAVVEQVFALLEDKTHTPDKIWPRR